MGFHLDGFLSVDGAVLALFDRVIPGGAGFTVPVPVHRRGLPAGRFLPAPWMLEHELGGPYTMAAEADLLDPDAAGAWRGAAGVPAGPDPLDAFCVTVLSLASLLSLAAPAGVVYLNDETHGGVLSHEYAAVFVAGRLRAAAGIDFLAGEGRGRAFTLRNGGYEAVSPAAVSPIADCATVLDRRFAGAFLFDGYLPRVTVPDNRTEEQPVPDFSMPPEQVERWAPYFPLLRC